MQPNPPTPFCPALGAPSSLATRGNVARGGAIHPFAAAARVPTPRRGLTPRRYGRGGPFFERGVEQSAARLAHNQEAAGSSPAPATLTAT